MGARHALARISAALLIVAGCDGTGAMDGGADGAAAHDATSGIDGGMRGDDAGPADAAAPAEDGGSADGSAVGADSGLDDGGAGDGGATGSEGGATDAEIEPDAAVLVAPRIASFTATPGAVLIGVATELTWSFTFEEPPTDPVSCTLDHGIGAVVFGATSIVTLSADTTYTLSCANAAGSDDAATVVLASAAPVAPVLDSFTATPSSFGASRPVDVTWTWTFSTEPTPAATCTIEPDVGVLTNGASSSVTLTADVEHTLTCDNGVGADSATLTLSTRSCTPFSCVHNDGCCAAGCESSTDDDCTNECGDGDVEEWESCDLGGAPPDYDCPYGQLSCSVCRTDCTFQSGTTSRCGDYRFDLDHEECDGGDCPEVCNDLDQCTTSVRVGSGCQRRCDHTPITACVGGDGCCPAGCEATDTDCACEPRGLEVPDDGVDDDCVGGDLTPSDAVGVFVATTGVDGAAGTMAAPLRTIGAAMAQAVTEGKVVFVAMGEYPEPITLRRSLFGGYEASTWTRDITANVTRIGAVTIDDRQVGPVALDGFTVGGCTAVHVDGNGVAAQISRNRIDARASCGTSSVGIGVHHATASIRNNLVHGGTTRSHTGIGVSGRLANVIIAHNYIYAGSSAEFSEGVSVGDDTRAILVDNVIDAGHGTWHAEPASAIELTTDGEAEVTLIHNDVIPVGTCLVDLGDRTCYRDLAFVNGCTWSGCVEAFGNLSAAPSISGAFPDLSIAAGSVCVDTGVDPSAHGAIVTDDILGGSRPSGAGWDIGPWEQ